MLRDWVAPMSLDEFRATCFRARPAAGVGTATAAAPLASFGAFCDVVGADGEPDVLTVAGGRLVDVPRPRSAAAVRSLLDAGVSVVVRGSERHSAPLAALARSFEDTIGAETHVQLYATPARTNSYGWHYDFEDVFIAQTAGVKDYYFRANTVDGHRALGEPVDFRVFAQEKSPLLSARLCPGDWLYIPARWWHLVVCVEESLSISVGVMGADVVRGARRIPAGWSGRTLPLPGGWPGGG